MQKYAKQFIDLLERQQLLSPDILDELRRQLAESKTRLTMELLAKLLVDNGHLTKFQATKLIAEIKASPATGHASLPSVDQEDELGFAPGPEVSNRTVGGKKQDAHVATVFVDDDLTDLSEAEIIDSEPIDKVESLEWAESRLPAVGLVDRVDAVGAFTTSNSDVFSSSTPPVSKVRHPPKSKANPYDSFRILGVGLLLALSLIAGFFLVNHFWRGNADERLSRADEAYEQRSYETAAAMYKEFADIFPANPRASYARVRSVLALLRKDIEGIANPNIGLETALAVLPGIGGEVGLAEQQSDLAGALIALAGKFNERADRASATDDRKLLMNDMDRLLSLINDPQYVGSNQRNQQSPTLNRIHEDRQRILREINRDDDLRTSLVEIDKNLEAQDTLGAYQVRSALIKRYPVLEADEPLTERVIRATVIQRELVTPGSLGIKLTKQSPSQVIGRSFILANNSGSGASALAGQVLFVKVKGSVYGIDGQSGEILWRNYIGREFHNEPLRLGQASLSDAIICQPEKGQLTRVEGKTGQTIWFAELGLPTHSPVTESDDLFVSTFNGTLASLDGVSGQAKWTTKLPQPIPVAAGVAFNKPQLYQPAEHSNLYVISRATGACQEVYYLGHRVGAITVPPILLLGQLFVFENINSQTAKIHVLSTSDQGLELKAAQVPFTMDGNIVVAPQVDGRRLIVQSDVGQIKVLDIEPTAESQKVTEIASIPKNVFEPKLSWLTADRNRIWIADSRFTRFDLQVASGKLTRAWIKNDGDRFIGPPYKIEDIIVHSRVLRGNQCVRISAVHSETGEPLWDTDIGSPVTLIQSSATGFDGINASGMYFALGNKPTRNQPDANPGQGKPAMAFTNPILLSDGRSVLLNQSQANQLALYTPNDGQKLRILSASLGGSSPSCDPVAVGDKLAIGLDSGQLVLIDPNNGAQVAAPYQPPMEPGRKVKWNSPAYFEDSQVLIAASDLQKLVRLAVGAELRQLTEVDLEHPLVGPIVAVGDRVCGIESTPSGDFLQFFDRSNLVKGQAWPLKGRRIAGPFTIAQGCLLQTDSELVAISDAGKQLWAIDFQDSELVSRPSMTADVIIVVTRGGGVWSIDPSAGKVIGKLDAGQPLSSAALVVPAGLLVGSGEGAVLALPMPSTQTSKSVFTTNGTLSEVP